VAFDHELCHEYRSHGVLLYWSAIGRNEGSENVIILIIIIIIIVIIIIIIIIIIISIRSVIQSLYALASIKR